MAWTAPRTWVVGEIVTASICNTHIRDDFNAIAYVLPLTAVASGDLSMTTSYQDISGATITLTPAGSWMIWAKFTFGINPADAGADILGQIVINGVAQSNYAWVRTQNVGGVDIRSSTVVMLKTGVVDGHIAKLQAKQSAGSASVVAANNNATSITARWVGIV